MFKRLKLNNFRAIVCLFVWWIFCPTWEFFNHLETLPLPVKCCKFWRILGTHGFWAVRITLAWIREFCLLWSSPRTEDTHTYCREFSSGATNTCFYDLCFSELRFNHPIFRIRGERSRRRRCFLCKNTIV